MAIHAMCRLKQTEIFNLFHLISTCTTRLPQLATDKHYYIIQRTDKCQLSYGGGKHSYERQKTLIYLFNVHYKAPCILH